MTEGIRPVYGNHPGHRTKTRERGRVYNRDTSAQRGKNPGRVNPSHLPKRTADLKASFRHPKPALPQTGAISPQLPPTKASLRPPKLAFSRISAPLRPRKPALTHRAVGIIRNRRGARAVYARCTEITPTPQLPAQHHKFRLRDHCVVVFCQWPLCHVSQRRWCVGHGRSCCIGRELISMIRISRCCWQCSFSDPSPPPLR